MTTTKMTVQEGLNQLKLLDSKISRGINELTLAGVVQKGKIKGKASTSVEKFKSKAKGQLDSVEALIANRNAIKSAIMVSNANTEIVVGTKKMTVAEAIDYRNTIDMYDQSLLETIKRQLFRAQNDVDEINSKIDRTTETRIQSLLGGSARTAEDTALVKSLEESAEKGKAEVLHGIKNLEEKISVMEAEQEDFLSKVDLALTTSNVTTVIEVELA